MMAEPLVVDTVLAAIQQVPELAPMSNIIPERVGFDLNLVKLLRGILGMAVLIAIAWLFSSNRKAVNWKMVGTGLVFQLLLAIGILYVPFLNSLARDLSKY